MNSKNKAFMLGVAIGIALHYGYVQSRGKGA